MQRLCEAQGCAARLRGEDASRGLRLCTICCNRLARQLSELPGLYLACEEVLEVSRGRGVGRVSGWRPGGIRLNEHSLNNRAAMVKIVSSWCAMVVDEHAVIAPHSLEIDALTAFLRAHLDWLLAHPAAADFAAEISGLVAAAHDALQPAGGRDRVLGRCIERGCDHPIRATVQLRNESPVQLVSCDAGHAWQPHQWMLLGRQLEQARLTPVRG